MDTRWTQHLPKDERDRFRNNVLASKDVLDRLDEILARMDKEAQKQKWSLKSYLNPAWAEFQADMNGTRRTIAEIRALLPKEDDYAK